MSTIVNYLPIALVLLGVAGIGFFLGPPKRIAAWIERSKPVPRVEPRAASSEITLPADNIPLNRVIAYEGTAPLVQQATNLVPGLLYLWAPRLSDVISVATQFEGTQRAIQLNNRLRQHRAAMAFIDASTLRPAAVLLSRYEDNAATIALLRRAKLAFTEVDPADPNAIRSAFDQFGWELPEAAQPESAAPKAASAADMEFIRERNDVLEPERQFEPIEIAATPAASEDPGSTAQPAELPSNRPKQPDMFRTEDADDEAAVPSSMKPVKRFRRPSAGPSDQ